ncbi:hypothetical protein [uncultured Mucilaginibacter sp.]|uniref:hypothetical protein n=1 Tax=uncultured Mucilaginibacter sp. TaxID=797541 RepID=UPI0025D64FD2|nr:hypothetical protein [uncultured Mucilaginibacter sp.]
METINQTTVTADIDEAITKLYDQNKFWLSEINFLDDEIKFITDLLDKFFITLIQDKYVNRIQLIKGQLISLGYVESNIKQDIIRHQIHIEEKINNKAAKSQIFLEMEDARIADELKDIHKNFKHIKTDIFAITSTLLLNNKQDQA